jgi:Transglutaminase-like superfamily
MQTRKHELRLAPHVHACQVDDQVILLDLRRDKYLAVGGRQMRSVASAVEDWPACAVDDRPASPAELGALTTPLLSQGLLTDQRLGHARLSAVTLEEATSTLSDHDVEQEPLIGPRRLLRFLQSTTAAAASLRCFSLLSVVRAAAARRARLARDSEPISLEAARNSVAAFETMRPLVFTARDKCLFDSLALVHFLAQEGMFPRWVIGVKTRPFAAHSWVQSGGVVLNDLHEHVRRYTPILIV